MATIELTGATVSIGGTKLSDYASTVSFEPEHEAALEQRIAMLPSFTMSFRGKLDPHVYRALFGRQHARIRRMRAAYGRRRGRGRW